MASLKAHEADRALARPDPAWRVFLIYGPDTGRVSEHAATLARASVDDPADPFQLIRLDGDAVAADPLRLLDEANTIGMFGGRRAIRVSPTSKALAAAVEPLLSVPPRDAVVIVEAGDLQRSNPLRVACERSRTAVAVPCYADNQRDLAGMIEEMVRAAGKTIGREVRESLVELLGGDRQTSRQEIDKLLLYVGDRSQIDMADVEAVVGDTAQREQSALVDAVFAGKLAAIDLAATKLAAEGLDAGVMLGSVLRHAQALLAARQAVDAGRSARDAVAAMRLPYPRVGAAEAALSGWTTIRLVEAIDLLADAILACRRNAPLARPVAQRALWSVARLSGARVRP